MKITITWQTCRQVSPYDYESYTEVIHIAQDMDMHKLYEKLKLYFTNTKKIDVQLHYEII